jgi:predicted metal-dependent hydrolase
MKQSRDPTRVATDAALQLSLPLFDPIHAAPAAPTRPPGRRHARLGEQLVEYELRRSRRRTIGFLIDGNGLRVTAPKWATLAAIDAALADKESWITRKLLEWRDHAQRRERLAVRWAHGERLSYLGRPVTMMPAPGSGVRLDDERLLVGLPPGSGADALRDTVRRWLQAQARALFAERLPIYSERLGRAPSRWGLSSARTRWGSCAPDGAIRLNWRLVHFPLEIVDYVIAHELSHLRHLNHGPHFWATVASLLPDYQRPRRLLREYPDDLMMS